MNFDANNEAEQAELAAWKSRYLTRTSELDNARVTIGRLQQALGEACDELDNIIGVDDEMTTGWRTLLRISKPEQYQALENLATHWVDMAQRQTDISLEYQSARAEGAAEGLRMCALMLRELLAQHHSGTGDPADDRTP